MTCELGDDRVNGRKASSPSAPTTATTPWAIWDGTWPHLLGYNRVALRPEAELLATIGGDPLVAVREVGSGRSAVFTSHCAPHRAPPAFSDERPGYRTLFDGLVRWFGSAG